MTLVVEEPQRGMSHSPEIFPSKGLEFNPLPCAHRALEDWSFRLVILTIQASSFEATIEQLVIVKFCKLVETCAIHQW